jgi:hypothetical protein
LGALGTQEVGGDGGDNAGPYRDARGKVVAATSVQATAQALEPRFYCPPADQAMDILKWHVRDQPRYGTVVWQMALIMGLQATFPCKS